MEELQKLSESLRPEIGKFILAISAIEQSLDHFISKIFDNDLFPVVALPKLDFRSKVSILEGWIDVIEGHVVQKGVRSRLHALYDQRNFVVHGYLIPLSTGAVFQNPKTGKQMSVDKLGPAIDAAEAILKEIWAATADMKAFHERRRKQPGLLSFAMSTDSNTPEWDKD